MSRENDGEMTMESPMTPDLGKWRVKRNLHIWGLIGIVLVLGGFMFWDALKSENPDEQTLEAMRESERKKNATLNKTSDKPASEDVQKVLQAQTDEAEKALKEQRERESAAANLPESLSGAKLPPVPIAKGQEKISAGLPPPKEMDQDAIKAEQMEERKLSSEILVLNHGSQNSGRSGARTSLDDIAANSAAERDKQLSAAKAEKDQMMAKLSSLSSAPGGAPGPTGAAGVSQRNGDERFLLEMENRGGANDVIKPKPARGAYALMQGSVIEAALMTEIKSDLPGDIKAQTIVDVYDNSGTWVVIPKRSVLVGKYNNEVKIGQEKIMAAFSRIIFPSGASVDLGAMKAAEADGASGIGDDVDNHFLKMFGTNFLIAGIAQLFQNESSSTTVNSYGTTNITNTAGDILADTVKTTNERNRTIQPTVTAYKGRRFIIMVNKDMVLPPYITGAK